MMANKSKIFKDIVLLKYYSTNKNINKHKDEILSYYLAGLIEGDGYIYLTAENRIIIGITFNIKDKPLAEKLLKYIGKGYIIIRKSKSIELRFSAVVSLKKIVA